MLRAQTAAAALAAGLSVLSNFVAVALNPRDSYAGGESAARPGAGAAASSRGAGAAIAEEEADSSGGRAAAETEEASEWAEEPSPASLEIPAEPPVRANAHAGGSARPAAHREEIETPEEPEGEPVAEAIVELDEEPAAEAAPAFDVANLPTELQDLHRRANRVAKVAMQDIKMLRPKDVRLGCEHKDICNRYAVISTRPVRNTTGASARFWIIRWITFTAGWWRSSPRGIVRPSENIRIPRPCCGTSRSAAQIRGWVVCAIGALLLCASASARGRGAAQRQSLRKHTASSLHAQPSASATAHLEALCRTLKEKKSAWAYSRLSAMAKKKSPGVLGIRAAFALGYSDYAKGKYAKALEWFSRTREAPLLGAYSVYWIGETKLALNEDADAIAEFKELLRDYPHSVMVEQSLESLAAAASAGNLPGEAISALSAYPNTASNPSLLFLRGQAYEQANQPVLAATDYQAVFLKFPANEKAREAGVRLSFLASTLGGKLAPIPPAQRAAHAAMLYASKDWGAARDEYSMLLPQLSGAELERAQLRILECGIQFGGTPAQIMTLHVNDPDVSAERLYDLADYYRAQEQDSQLSATIEQLSSESPSSKWTEQALFLGGNYFWVQLERDAATEYYGRVARDFPNSPDAVPAQWRV